jgi:RNA polymerase sigma-70 factor (ECF subfamily)
VRGTPLEDDRTLVAAFKRGDRAALTVVFRTYVDEVTRQVRVSRLPEHEVEAMTQEIFLKAFSDDARARWDGLRPYGAWLNTMTRNALIDRARKERRLDFRAPDDMPDIVDDSASAADDVDARELAAVLQQFTDAMSPEERTLFATRFEQGLSLGQTAKALGWSEIKVRTVDTRLRARLLEQAQGAGFFERVKVKIGASLLGRRGKKKDAATDAAPSGGRP